MHGYSLSSICAKAVGSLRRDQSGAVALLLVMGATLTMVLIGVSIASQARQELRMARAETDAAALHLLVQSAFQEAAARAEADPTWPPATPTGRICTWTDLGPNLQSPGAPYPSYCIQALQRRLVPTSAGDYIEIPLRVITQIRETGPPTATYGWLLLGDTNRVEFIRYQHRWCTYDPSLLPPLGHCLPGGS